MKRSAAVDFGEDNRLEPATSGVKDQLVIHRSDRSHDQG
jgi:hypothetical protein